MQTELAKSYFSSLFITNSFIIEVHSKNGQYSVDVDQDFKELFLRQTSILTTSEQVFPLFVVDCLLHLLRNEFHAGFILNDLGSFIYLISYFGKL